MERKLPCAHHPQTETGTSPLSHADAQLTYQCGDERCSHKDSRDGASARCFAARARVDYRQAAMGKWGAEARAAAAHARGDVVRARDMAREAMAARARSRYMRPAFVAWAGHRVRSPPPTVPPLPWPCGAVRNAHQCMEQADRALEELASARRRLDEVQAKRSADVAVTRAREAQRWAREVIQVLGTAGGQPGGAFGHGGPGLGARL